MQDVAAWWTTQGQSTPTGQRTIGGHSVAPDRTRRVCARGRTIRTAEAAAAEQAEAEAEAAAARAAHCVRMRTGFSPCMRSMAHPPRFVRRGPPNLPQPTSPRASCLPSPVPRAGRDHTARPPASARARGRDHRLQERGPPEAPPHAASSEEGPPRSAAPERSGILVPRDPPAIQPGHVLPECRRFMYALMAPRWQMRSRAVSTRSKVPARMRWVAVCPASSMEMAVSRTRLWHRRR